MGGVAAIRVLLVDDDQSVIDLATGLLVGEGDISVEVVGSGQAALDKLIAAKYDAVVSEYDIPDMNGIDLLRSARERGYADLYLILTSTCEETVALDAILSGADHFIHKTGSSSQDIALVRSILLKRHDQAEQDRDRLSGQAYHALLMRMDQGFAYHRIIYGVDGCPVSSMIVDANQAFERTMGCSEESILGRDVRSLFSDDDPFDRALLTSFNDLLTGKGEIRFEVFSPLRGKWLSALLLPSEPGNFVTIVTDTTAQSRPARTDGTVFPAKESETYYLRQLEEELVRVKRDREIILDTTPAMISIKDRRGEYIKVNRAFATRMGSSPDKLPRIPFKELHPRRWEAMHREDMDVINTGKPLLGVEKQYLSLSGETFWALVDKLPYRDEKGEIIGVLSYAIDITERKEVEQELVLARKKLRLLGSVTRHDILNKLSALHGYLSLTEYKQDLVDVKELIAKADAASEQIRKLMEFTRAYEQVGAQRPEWLQAKEAVSKGIDEAHPPETKVFISLDGLEVYADRMIEKAFYNLVDNSIRHGKASRIDIFYVESGGEVRIVFQDDGLGITDEARGTIFDDRFGHGLYLVKEILKLTGMTIIETSPERGARFEITIPPDSYRFS